MDPRPPSYRFGPLEQRGFLAGLRVGQLACLVAGALGVVLLGGAARSPAALLLAAVVAAVAAAAAFVPVRGRSPEQWLPLTARHAWRLLRGAHRFVSPAPLMGHTHPGGPPVATPDTLRGVSIVSVDGRAGLPADVPAGIGMVKDARARTYSGVLQVGGRPFVLLDPDEQARVVDSWAGILGSFGRERSPVRRIQWIERTCADTGEEAARYLSEAVQLPLDHPAVRAYLGLLDASRPTTQQHETFVILQIDRVRANRASRRHADRDAGAYAVLVREMEALAASLQAAGLEVLGALPPRAVARVIRVAFEPDSRHGLTLRAAGGGETGVHPASAWPLAAETSWSSYRTGSTVHAVYWVREWPRSGVGPDFLVPLLLKPRATRTVSMVMEPVPPLTAQREVEAARVADASDEHMRQRAGFMTTFRRVREQQQVLAREQELADGHSEIRFSAYVAVSAASPEELDRACSDVEQQAGQARLELARLHGDQDVAFTYCLPLGRGLR